MSAADLLHDSCWIFFFSVRSVQLKALQAVDTWLTLKVGVANLCPSRFKLVLNSIVLMSMLYVIHYQQTEAQGGWLTTVSHIGHHEGSIGPLPMTDLDYRAWSLCSMHA